MLRTTKPQAFTCLRNDLSSWLFSCSGMGGVCLLYLGCWCFFPSSLLGMFRTGGDLECRGERLSPHPHWFRKSHLYCGQPHKDVVGEGVQVFVFFFSSFPHLSSVARGPSQQRYSWFPVLHSPNMASHSPWPSTGKDREVLCSQGNWVTERGLPGRPTFPLSALSHFAQCGSENTSYLLSIESFSFAMGHCVRIVSPTDRWASPILLASATWSGS